MMKAINSWNPGRVKLLHRTRKARRLAAVGLVAALVALFWSQGQSAWSAGRVARPQSLAQVISRIEQETSAERGLAPRHPVTATILPAAQFSARLLRAFDRETSARDIDIADRVYVLLGLLDSKTDLRAVYRRAFGSSVVGFYDPRTKSLYVRATGHTLTPYEQVVISHEYTHALQDQYFDLRRLQASATHKLVHNSDRDSAVQAVVEGDATLEMLLYARDYLNKTDRDAYLRGETGAGAPSGIPPYIMDALQFPYDQGLGFTISAYRRAGHAGLNALFRHPPQGTDEILHPELYSGAAGTAAPGTQPLPPLSLGAGWTLQDSDVVGEFQIRDFLAQALPKDVAVAAANGWRGDRYALYVNGKQSLFGWRLVWRDAAQAARFVEAFGSYARARMTGSGAYPPIKLTRSGSVVVVALGSGGVAAPAAERLLRGLP